MRPQCPDTRSSTLQAANTKTCVVEILDHAINLTLRKDKITADNTKHKMASIVDPEMKRNECLPDLIGPSKRLRTISRRGKIRKVRQNNTVLVSSKYLQ